MTKRQLRVFFSKFNLPEDYSEQSIAELKKILLLELKSAPDNSLFIDARDWTRNDILEFFDGKLEDGFDEVSFYTQFPWAKAISEPKKINYSTASEQMNFDDPAFEEFRNREAVHYEKAYLDELRSDMREKRDLPVAGMLCYLECFRTEFQFMVLNTMRSMMNSRLNDAMAAINTSASRNKLTNIRFMQSAGYYLVLKKIADDDSDLLITNLQVFGSGIAGGSIDKVIDIIRKQKTLPLPPEGIQFLDEVYKEVIALKVGNAKSENNGNWNTVGTVFGIIVAVVIALFKCSRSISHYNSSDYSTPRAVPRTIISRDTAFIVTTNGDTTKIPLKQNPQILDSVLLQGGNH